MAHEYDDDYTDDYDTCDATYAQLIVYPGERGAGFVTERLGIDPSQTSARDNARVVLRSGDSRLLPPGRWVLSSEGHVTSNDLRRHLDWLLDALAPARGAVLALGALPDLVMTLDCVWRSAHAHGGPMLGPRHMRAIAALGLECGFEVTFAEVFMD